MKASSMYQVIMDPIIMIQGVLRVFLFCFMGAQPFSGSLSQLLSPDKGLVQIIIQSLKTIDQIKLS